MLPASLGAPAGPSFLASLSARPFFERDRRRRALTMAVLGDSFGNDEGASSGANGWGSLTAARIGATRANRSVNGSVLQNSADAGGGARADNGRDTYAAQLLGGNAADFAWIARGFNDARYIGAPATFNVAAFENDLDEVIVGLLASGLYGADDLGIVAAYWISDTGLLTHFGDANFSGQTRAGFLAFVAASRRVAARRNVFWADAYGRALIGGGEALLAPDGVHYNDAGHRVIAEACLSARRLIV